MKGISRNVWKNVLSIVLAVCMVLGMCTTALATGTVSGDDVTNSDPIKYVSLGDSMSNGYGLDGYDGNTGVEDYGDGSYANQFAEHYGFEHYQLAMSAMRAEDLHWLLEVDYDDPAVINVINTLQTRGWNEELWYSVFTNGDYWTWDELVNNYRFDVAAYCIEGKDNGGAFSTDTAKSTYTDVQALEIVAKYYQESVANADVISLGMGNGNFGVFMFGRIMDAIGFNGGTPEDAMIYNVDNAIRECDPKLQAEIRTLLSQVTTILASKGIMADDGDANTVSTMEALYNTLVYGVISYALNYAGSVEAILQLNSDAEIIQVALMNTVKGGTAAVGETTLGELMDLLFEPLNAFIAALPTYMQATNNSVYDEATFYFAEAPYVECVVDTYEAPLDGTVRNRFYHSIVKEEDGNTGMVWGMLGNMVVDISEDEIAAYEGMSDAEKIAYAAANSDKAMSIAIYLAFENAIVASKNSAVTIEAVLGVTSLLAPGANPFGSIMEEFYAAAAIEGAVKYDSVAGIMTEGDAAKKTVAMALLGNEEAIKALASSLVSWGNVQHVTIDEILACDDDSCGFGCNDARNAYNDLMANPVYGYVAMQSAGLLTGAQVKALYESYIEEKESADIDDNDAAVAAFILEFCKNYVASTMVSDSVDFATALATVNAGYGSVGEITSAVDGIVAVITGVETANATVTGIQSLCTLIVTPDVLGDVVANSELKGLIALFARCIIGNGIGSHPSAGGHDALYAAVVDAYDNEHTAADETLNNLKWAADKAIELVVEYYDDAYAYAYSYAAEQGYIGLAAGAIDGLIDDVMGIDVDGIEATEEFKSEVKKSVGEIVETLRAAKELLLGADKLDNETLEAVMTLLDEAADIINALVDTLTQAGYDVTELVIIPALEDAYEKLTEEVIPEILEKLGEAVEKATDMLLEKLGDAYDAFVDAVVEAAKEYAPKVADWIYDYLYNNPEKVIGFFNEYGDEIGAFLAEYGDEALMVIGYIAYEFGDEIAELVIANADEIMEQMVLWVEEHGENAWDLIMVYLKELGILDAIDGVIDAVTNPENIDKILEEIGKLVATYGPEIIEGLYDHLDSLGYIDAVRDIIDSLMAEADRIENEVIPEIIDVIEGLYKELEDLNAELEKLYAELEKATGEAKEIIEAAIAEIEAAIAEIEAAIEALENALEEITAKVEEIYAAAEDLAAALDNLLDVIENAGEDIAEAIDMVQAALDKVGEAIEFAKDVIDAVNDAIDNVQELVDNAINAALELRDEVKAIVEELKNAVSKLTGEAREIAENVIAGIEKAIAFYDMAVETIAKAAEVLPEVIETVQDIADVVITAINAFEETISGEYTVTDDSYYVAVGNDTSYGELLAADMGLDADQFVQLGQDGVTIANIADVLDADGVAAVSKADLITVGFGNSLVLDFVAAYLNAPYELDWTALVTEDGVPYVEDALAEVEAYFAETGLDASVTEILMQAVEAYAYGYVAMAVSVPALVEAIHEINPEALVVIVGMYNPLEGVVLAQGDVKIPVGDFVDNFVQLANAELFAYALLNENTMFVDAPDVETSLAAGEYPAFGFIINFNNNIAKSAPTEAGNEYIKDRILEALDVTVEEDVVDVLLGDVDLDGDVDARDASMAYAIFNGRLAASEAQLLAADVNADGEVLARDAAMIYAYHNGTLAAFPAA